MSRWAIFTFVPEALCHQSRVLILERCSVQRGPPWSKISQSVTPWFWTGLDRWTTNKQPVNCRQLKDVDLIIQQNIVMPFKPTSCSLILPQCCELCCYLFHISALSRNPRKRIHPKAARTCSWRKEPGCYVVLLWQDRVPLFTGKLQLRYAASKITFSKFTDTNQRRPDIRLLPPTPRLSDLVF